MSKPIIALFVILIMALPATTYEQPKREAGFYPQNQPQYEAFWNTSPNLLNDGPWGTGKTYALAWKAWYLADRYKNNLIGLVRRKRVHLEATLWKEFISILPKEQVVASNDTKLYRKLRNGSEIYGLGLDSDHAVNLMDSRQFGFIAVEEAKEITEEIFDTKIQRCMRLNVPFRQIQLATNPDSPGHFLYKRFIQNPQPGYARIQGKRLPSLPADYIERINALTGVWRLRYRDGLWTAFEGQVYPFDPEKHLVSRADLWEGWESWRSVVGVDFGFDHPFVCQWWKVSPSGLWLLYREMYMTHRTVNKHAPLIKKYCEQDGIDPVIICDHDAEDRATLEEHGLYTKPAKKDRLAGQNAVYELFEQDRIMFLRDAIVETDQRLIMENRPTCTVDEFPSYIWANKAKEDMTKEKDDGMDTMRYCVYTEKAEFSDIRIRYL